MRFGFIPSLFLTLILSTAPVFAADAAIDEYTKAEKALAVRNFREADFWITRLLARDASYDIKALLKKRQLATTYLLSPEYDAGFIDWFMTSSRALWRVSNDKIKPGLRTFELRMTHEGRYFAAVIASPKLEQWSVSKPGASVNILSMGDAASKVTLLSNYPTLFLETGKHSLQNVWPPQIKDIDNDKIPEIFVRYNLTWGNGFRQYLAIYKIKNDIRLELLRKFEGQNDGVARLRDDEQVEVASGVASKASLSQMHYDLYRAEYWKFNGKDYEKAGEATFPHPLRSEEWQKFV